MATAYSPTLPHSEAWQVSTPLRRVLLLAPPFLLAAWATVHPAPDVNAQAVMDVATWFAVFHVVQLVLVGLVTLTVLLLADAYGAARSWTVRLGLGVFLIFFTAYDAIAGIATGLAMRHARDLPAAQQEGVWQTVKDWPGLDAPVFALSIVGSLAWVVALVAIALAARRAGVARAEWIFVALAGVFLLGGHPFPFGTIALGCVYVAVLLHLRASLRARAPEVA